MKTNTKGIEKKDVEICLRILEFYKREHKQHWYDFLKGMLWGYMHSTPTYTEASVIDFEEWLNDYLNSLKK